MADGSRRRGGDTEPCIVDPVADPRWRDLIDESPHAQIYHHPLWLAALRDQYRFSTEAWCIARGNGELVAGLPVLTVRSRLTGNRMVSVPFSDTCQAVIRDADPDTEAALSLAIEQERTRRGLPLEIHGPAPEGVSARPGDAFLHHILAVEAGVDASMAAVHSSRRRDARRAARLSVTVTRRTDAQAMDAFYHLQVLTRRRHGLPTQPRGFFHRLRRLFAAGLGYLLMAEWEGHTVAAAVYLRFGDTLVHKYGASDPAHLKLRANSLVYVEAIHHACEEGCTVLDFGRTELDNAGLRAFKLSFGAQERTLRYSWIGRQRDPASVRSVSHWQQSVIRRAPPVLGRVIGAAVYRHFA